MTLAEILQRAIARRGDLLARLHAEGTDAYRLLHGIAEGAPGVTVDRYGSLLLVQTFREALAANDLAPLRAVVVEQLGLDLPIVANHRGDGAPGPAAAAPGCDADGDGDHVCRERGVRFAIRARHRGQDPWLFLDLRAGRRAIAARAAGKRVLNLFAYTCGVGVAAAVAGAEHVLNVDFAQSALAVGERNAAANAVAAGRFAVLHADCIPVLRQLAGLPVQRRGKHVPFVRVKRQPFDLIALDPPRFAKGPFGTIDVVRDYPSLFKPCLLALGDRGAVLATNHVPSVTEGEWHDVLRRCAAKAGRPLRSLEPVPIEDDFPSFDGRPPLKIAWCEL